MKAKITALLGAALLAGWAVPAWGHVTAEDPSVPSDSDVEITFLVPVEQGAGHAHEMHAMHEGHDEPAGGENQGEPSKVYNQQVTITVPPEFVVLSCDKTAEWDCAAAPTKHSSHSSGPNGGTITFTRLTKSGTTMDHLSFSVHSPRLPGTYYFPTTQKLSDGEHTDWRGRAGSENPAPTVQVADERSAEAGGAGHDAGHK
jgi:hypothetical protein